MIYDYTTRYKLSKVTARKALEVLKANQEQGVTGTTFIENLGDDPLTQGCTWDYLQALRCNKVVYLAELVDSFTTTE